MKTYTWTDGRTFTYLPNPFENTSPVTEAWWTAHGGTVTETPDPPEPTPDTTERDNAEKAIVSAIKALAVKYDALSDLAQLIANDQLAIPNLLQLAAAKGVSDVEIGALISGLTPYKWQLEAVTGLLWAECWDGLKSRFAQWMQEVATA